MVRSIGVDICDTNEIDRLLKLKDNAFMNHTFTQKEIVIAKKHKDQAQYFASLFAGKEATFKALSTLQSSFPIDLRNIEIINDIDDDPCVNLEISLMKSLSIQHILISLSYSSHYTIAMVMIE
ncbi:MAG: holo-ACP synthase [Erysipelotrichaceae bacterium]|nr:holo-ACP synthase [Erysipelotrichaceae bacterium]